MTRLAAELEFEKRLTNEAKEKFAKQEKECARLSEELKIVSAKYTELLGVIVGSPSLVTNCRRTSRGTCKPPSKKSDAKTNSDSI